MSFSRLSPFVLVLISAVLWALQPVFILTIGSKNPSLVWTFLVINTAVTGICGGILMLRHIHNWRLRLRRLGALLARIKKYIILDAIFSASSYVMLSLAARNGELPANAVIFEGWPIFTAIILFFILKRENDRAWSSLLAVSIFFVGFILLNTETFSLSILGKSSTYFALAAAALMGCAVATIQKLMNQHPLFKRVGMFSSLILVRETGKTLALICFIAFSSKASFDFRIGQQEVMLAIALGILVAANSYFYHIGAARSTSNSIALVALVSPVLAPIFLILLGQELPNVNFAIGAIYIVSAVAITLRNGDHSIQFISLVLSILLLGTSIHYIQGNPDQGFFEYLNLLIIFYVLLQTSTFSRLWQASSDVEFRARSLRRKYLARHRRDTLQYIREDIDFLKASRARHTTISELVLLTVLSLSMVILMLLNRDTSSIASGTIFLIGITSVFLITYCWSMQIGIFRAASVKRLLTGVGEPSILASNKRFSLAFTVFLFIAFFVIIIWF